MPISHKIYAPFEGQEPVPVAEVDEEHYKIKTECIAYGFMRIYKKIYEPKKTKVSNAYPEFWMTFFADLPPGYSIRVYHKRKVYNLSGKCALYVPEKAIVEWEIPPGWLEWVGYTSIFPVTSAFPNEAVAFRIPHIPTFRSHDEMISFIERYMPASTSHHEPDDRERTHQRVKDYISQNFRKNITIAQMGIDLDIPVSSITHEFKRVYGIPPHKYIHILRVFQALDHVSTGDEVTKIISEVGYKNYSSLYRHCMSVLRKPPSFFGRRGFAPQAGGIDLKAIDRLA